MLLAGLNHPVQSARLQAQIFAGKERQNPPCKACRSLIAPTWFYTKTAELIQQKISLFQPIIRFSVGSFIF